MNLDNAFNILLVLSWGKLNANILYTDNQQKKASDALLFGGEY
jgi:hypothetical protein